MFISEFGNPEVKGYLASDETGWKGFDKRDVTLMLSKIPVDGRFSQVMGAVVQRGRPLTGPAPLDRALADPVGSASFQGMLDAKEGVLYDVGEDLAKLDGIRLKGHGHVTEHSLAEVAGRARAAAASTLEARVRALPAFDSLVESYRGEIAGDARQASMIRSAVERGAKSLEEALDPHGLDPRSPIGSPFSVDISSRSDHAACLDFLRDPESAAAEIADAVLSDRGADALCAELSRHDALEQVFEGELEHQREPLGEIDHMKQALASSVPSGDSKVWVTFERGDRKARVQMSARDIQEMAPGDRVGSGVSHLTWKGRDDLAAAFGVDRGVGGFTPGFMFYPRLSDATRVDYRKREVYAAPPERAAAARATEPAKVGIYRISEAWARENLYRVDYGTRGDKGGRGPAPANVFEAFNAAHGFARTEPADVGDVDGASVPAAEATFDQGFEVRVPAGAGADEVAAICATEAERRGISFDQGDLIAVDGDTYMCQGDPDGYVSLGSTAMAPMPFTLDPDGGGLIPERSEETAREPARSVEEIAHDGVVGEQAREAGRESHAQMDAKAEAL